jgi:hypothetical protein
MKNKILLLLILSWTRIHTKIELHFKFKHTQQHIENITEFNSQIIIKWLR